MMPGRIAALICAGLLAACAGGEAVAPLSQGNPLPTGTGSSARSDARAVTLTAAEHQAVESAVKSMLAPPGEARFGPLKSARATGSDGGADRLQVCGHVAALSGAGAGADMIRFYVEFKYDAGAVPEAIRGQIATIPANASKIAFVCAKHGLT